MLCVWLLLLAAMFAWETIVGGECGYTRIAFLFGAITKEGGLFVVPSYVVIFRKFLLLIVTTFLMYLTLYFLKDASAGQMIVYRAYLASFLFTVVQMICVPGTVMSELVLRIVSGKRHFAKFSRISQQIFRFGAFSLAVLCLTFAYFGMPLFAALTLYIYYTSKHASI